MLTAPSIRATPLFEFCCWLVCCLISFPCPDFEICSCFYYNILYEFMSLHKKKRKKKKKLKCWFIRCLLSWKSSCYVLTTLIATISLKMKICTAACVFLLIDDVTVVAYRLIKAWNYRRGKVNQGSTCPEDFWDLIDWFV